MSIDPLAADSSRFFKILGYALGCSRMLGGFLGFLGRLLRDSWKILEGVWDSWRFWRDFGGILGVFKDSRMILRDS